MKKKILSIVLISIILLSIIIILVKILDVIDFKCIYKEIFNIYCPGCGTTRMIKYIFKFKFYQAFRCNPLIFILLIIVAIYLIYNSILYLTNKKLYIPSKKIILIITIILVLYMVLRNIPGLEFLQPTNI